MKTPRIGVFALLSATALLGMTALSGCKEAARPTPTPSPSGVTAGGFTLASMAVDLPNDDQPFPNGPGAAAVNANCASCHSPSMVLTQPRLKPDQWKATVTKMREVYHAPIADADVPAILTYLNALSAKR